MFQVLNQFYNLPHLVICSNVILQFILLESKVTDFCQVFTGARSGVQKGAQELCSSQPVMEDLEGTKKNPNSSFNVFTNLIK